MCAHSTCCQCGRIGPAENLLMLTRLPTFMQALCKNDINSINTVLYLIHTFLRPLNDQHAQKFAAKPVIHIYDIYTYLLHVYCNLIDSLFVFSSKRPFTIIVQTSTFRSWFTCLFALKSLVILIK